MERQWVSLIRSDRFGLKSLSGLKELSLELAVYDFAFLRSINANSLDSNYEVTSADREWDDKACSIVTRVPVLDALKSLSVLKLKTLNLCVLRRDEMGWSKLAVESLEEMLELQKLAKHVELRFEEKDTARKREKKTRVFG